MATGPNLRVRISADLADIKQGLGLLRNELGAVKRTAERASPSTSKWQQGLAAVRRQLLGIVSVYGALRVGGAYLRLADEASTLAGRLRLATKSQEEFNRAHRETFRIAQSTSADWGGIIGLYAQLAQTTGMAQERILELTEAVGLSFAVSGSSAQDTSRGIVQLQQAMAGGILRAQEFNTLIETNPRLVQALADHFGISFGRVRQYVNDGKVTTEDMAQATIAAVGDMRKEFERLPPTVGRAMQQLRNSLLRLVGDTDQAEGASRDLAEAISDLARFLESDDAKRGLAALITGVAEAARLFGQLAGKIAEAHSKYREWLNTQGFAKSESLNDVEHLDERIRKLARMQYGSGFLADVRRAVFGDSIRKELQAAIAARNRLLSGDKPDDEPAGAGAQDSPKPTDPSGSAKAIARSNALVRDSVQRTLAELDRMYAAHEVGISEYFAARQELQQQAIDLQIEQARNELAITKDLGKRRDLEEQIAILLRDRAEAATTAAREQKAAEEELAKQLGEVKLRLLELDGETGRVARAKLEEEYRDLFKRLEAASDETGKALVRNLVDRLAAKAQSDEIVAAVGRVTSGLSAQEGSISAQMDAGALGFMEGERRLEQLRANALAQLRELRQAQLDYLETLSPESRDYVDAVQALAGIDLELSNILASMDRLGQGIADAGAGALNSFWTNLREQGLQGMETVKALVADFARGVYDVVAQDFTKAIVGGVRSLLGRLGDRAADASGEAAAATTAASIQTTAATASAATITAGATTAGATLTAAGTAVSAALVSAATTAAAIMRTASAFGMAAGVAHSGGIAGMLGTVRHNLSPLLFGAAPRYHTGGIAGLGANEVPAILQRGEEVLTRTDPRHRFNGGMGGEGDRTLVKQPIVAIGDRAVADALASAAGEEIILTHVRNNWDGLVGGAR